MENKILLKKAINAGCKSVSDFAKFVKKYKKVVIPVKDRYTYVIYY